MILVTLFFSLNLFANSPAPLPAPIKVGTQAKLLSMDPFVLNGIEAYDITGNIVEPLARINPYTKVLEPCLAVSWKVDLAKNKLRVELRENVTFHSGEVLSAEDVKFTLEAYRDPKFKADFWRPMWADVEKVEVLSNRLVEFKFKRLTYQAYSNVMTALRILPRVIYADSLRKHRDVRLIGTGPFRQLRFDPGQRLELEPFEGWWGTKPTFELVIKSVADVKQAELMVAKGELDYFPAPMGFQPVKEKANVFGFDSATGEGLWIDLNLRKSLFLDIRVRKALVLLWDRESLNKKIYGGAWTLVADSFSPAMSFYPPAAPEKFQPAEAVKLLKAAGFVDSNKDGVIDRTVGGVRQEFVFTLLVKSQDSERWATLFQADAAKVGVRVNIRRLEEDAQWWQILKEGQFDALAAGGASNDEVYPATWRSNGAYAFFGFSDAAVDRALDKLDQEFNLQKRAGIQRVLIARVRSLRPQVPGLFSRQRYFILSKRVDVDPKAPTHAWRWRTKD